MDFSEDELREQLGSEMHHLGGWGYAAVAAEMNRRSTERQATEANGLASEIRDLTRQIRTLTWVVVALGVAAVVLAILK
jgi:hypothetical protein